MQGLDQNAQRPAVAILFDLDGTLTDPLEGITRSIQHALERLGARNRTRAELAAYIGPPLRGTFAFLLETQDPLAIERAMSLYRERFSAIGLFENEVYADVPDILARLQSMRYALYIATAKPGIYAEKILEHFSLARYFTAIYGSELDGRYDDKAELIAHILRQERLAPDTTVMVGDRSHDIVAARQNGLRSIGVTYGYGTYEELVEAGADRICRTPADILAYFCQ